MLVLATHFEDLLAGSKGVVLRQSEADVRPVEFEDSVDLGFFEEGNRLFAGELASDVVANRLGDFALDPEPRSRDREANLVVAVFDVTKLEKKRQG